MGAGTARDPPGVSDGHRTAKADHRDRTGDAATAGRDRTRPRGRTRGSARPRAGAGRSRTSSVVNHRSATLEGLATDVRTEPIVAWRAWALTGHRDGTGLLLRPVAKRARLWRPREIVEASCRTSRRHEAPDPRCTCGLHATHAIDPLRRTRSPAVLGRVALWGRVVEHEHGFRAQYAYPQRLRLICQFCFWMSEPRRSTPDHVGWFPHDELIPVCEEHLAVGRRNGVSPRLVLPASEVVQRLRDTYAVDPLAV
jgi:hypothetical protein